MSDEQWDAILRVHNTAPFRIVRAAAPFMRGEAKKEIDRDGVAASRSIINVRVAPGNVNRE